MRDLITVFYVRQVLRHIRLGIVLVCRVLKNSLDNETVQPLYKHFTHFKSFCRLERMIQNASINKRCQASKYLSTYIRTLLG